MNNAIIEQLVRARVADWEYFEVEKFTSENINFDTPEGIWFELFIQSGANTVVGIADRPIVRELGAVVIQIYCNKNEMTGRVKELADSLGEHLRHYQSGKLTLLTPSATNVGASNGGYLYSVRVPYRYN